MNVQKSFFVFVVSVLLLIDLSPNWGTWSLSAWSVDNFEQQFFLFCYLRFGLALVWFWSYTGISSIPEWIYLGLFLEILYHKSSWERKRERERYKEKRRKLIGSSMYIYTIFGEMVSRFLAFGQFTSSRNIILYKCLCVYVYGNTCVCVCILLLCEGTDSIYLRQS